MSSDNGYYTPQEVCGKLRISRWTLWRLTQSIRLPYLKLGRRTIRYLKEPVDKWLADITIHGPADALRLSDGRRKSNRA